MLTPVRVAALLLLGGLLALVSTASAQSRGATLRKRIDQRGDLTFAANSSHTCTNNTTSCSNSKTQGSSNDNNDYTMDYVDSDSDGTTFNSSAATLSIPSGASITWAGLYWMCPVGRGAAANPPDLDSRDRVRFKVPGGAYATVVATQFDTGMASPPIEGYGQAFMGFRDVTSLVQAAGTGNYWVANMQCSHNISNVFSGWTLMVIYADPTAPLRTISVFDAYTQYTSSNDVTLTLSGFVTPPTGNVNTDRKSVV